MFRGSVFMVVAAFLFLGASSPAFAAPPSLSTFSVSPPPIATPVFFDVKETDEQIGVMHLSMKSTDPEKHFKLDGYGLDSVTRKAIGNSLAIDYSIGVAYMTGTIALASTGFSQSGLKGIDIPIGLNLEFQAYKNDTFNITFFAGPAINLSLMQIDSDSVQSGTTTTSSITTDSDSFIYGPQAGLQMGFKMGDFHINLFGMATSLHGTQYSSSNGGSTSADIPAYTSTSTGADLVYEPWGLTLSSLLQEAKQRNQNGFRTSIYQFSWSKKF